MIVELPCKLGRTGEGELFDLEGFLEGEIETVRPVLAESDVGAQVGSRSLVQQQPEASAGADRDRLEQGLAAVIRRSPRNRPSS